MAPQNDALGSPAYDIYTGFWIDWSYGRVMGATITLSKANGSLLVAFLALFVSFVGTNVWRIVCYGLHHFYSREAAQDALYHQRQAILRNSTNAASGTWSLLQVISTWKGEKAAQRPYQRILPLLSLALCCIGAAGAAGTFSSRVTTAMGYHVLLANPNCTTLSGDVGISETSRNTVLEYLSEQTAQWNNWAERCYTESTFFGNCKQFTEDRLKSTIISNATCPFPGDICLTTNSSGSMVLDTGFLDSHEDFGINAPKDERIIFRQKTSCAPLATEGYQYEARLSDGRKAMVYLYGNKTAFQNYTYTYPILNVTDMETYGQSYFPDEYTISVHAAFTFNGTIRTTGGTLEFTPIPDLQVHDADLNIIFLSANSVVFAGPVDDPWYSAHVSTGSSLEPSDIIYTNSRYTDKPASPLACMTQCQICNPNLPESSRCTAPSGFMDLRDRVRRLWTDKKHLEIFNAFMSTLGLVSSPPDVVQVLGVGALAARRSKIGNQQYPVPNDQWQRDLEQWHATSLVSIQAAAISTATQSRNAQWEHILVPIESEEGKKMCRNIKVYNSAYSNFSVFGLSFMLVVGTIIIILSYTLEPLVVWIQRKRNYDTYARLEWTCNETLQLQRMANEEPLLGDGTWRRCVDAVPIPTRANQRLALLDVSDRDHPVLKAPPATLENVLCKPESQKAGPSYEDEVEETVIREV